MIPPNWHLQKDDTSIHELPDEEGEEAEDDRDEEDEQELAFEPQGYQIYSSIGALISDWGQKKAISGILVGGNNTVTEFYCCVRTLTGKIAVQFTRVGEPVYEFGLHYHEFERLVEDEFVDWEELSPSRYAVLLHLVNEDEEEDEKHMCAMITSDWKSMGWGGTMVEPHKVILDKEFNAWK